MDLLGSEPDIADPARLELEVSRVADRLRSMALARLSAPREDGTSPASEAFGLAQAMVDAAAQLGTGPARPLPSLPDAAAGDVLAVCAQELAGALRGQAAGGRRDEVCRTAVRSLIGLRRSL